MNNGVQCIIVHCLAYIMCSEINHHDVLVVRINGVKLNPAQTKLAIPILNDHHAGMIRHGEMVSRIIKACATGDVPVRVANDHEDFQDAEAEEVAA